MEVIVADFIQAQEGALRAGASAVSTCKANIDARTKDVRNEIAQLSGMWTGAAASAYNNMMTAWDEQARKLNDGLIALEDSLRSTEKDQAATEEAHQSTIRSLDVGSIMGA